tara:strand:+ start:737 stop:1024 length:288 start_codon:yes stop_codon:yes gene_type:complete
MFWFNYLKFKFGLRKKSELSSISDILSSSFIKQHISEHLSEIYEDYSYRTESKKINNATVVCARVRCGKKQSPKSTKHWFVYQEGFGSVSSWCLD